MKVRWLMALAVGLLIAADAAKDDTRKEFDKFKGTWTFVSLESEGMKAPEEGFKNSKLVLMGDKWTFTQGTAESKGTFKVDLTQKPKTIDITFTEGPEKGKTVLGIYELEGDTYKLCLSLKDKDRPKEFVSKAGSGHILEVLKRQKP